MTILFVTGVNDASTVGIALDDDYRVGYVYNGNCSIHGKLPLRKGIDSYVLLLGSGVRQPKFSFVVRPSLIVNQIADPDTHRGALERCIELCAQVDSLVINRPERVLETARDRVSELLQGIPGVHMPRTIRFAPRSPDEVFAHAQREGFGFPFIVREAGLHNGLRMLRINSADDLDELHAFPFDGREFYLTEYVDYRDDSGLFQRQRIYVIDGRPVLRAALYDEKWKVHGSSRHFMLEREDWSADRERSRRYEEEIIPRLEEPVREIARRLGLELFGIDCSMNPDGTMLVFEANANMNMLHNPHPQMNPRMRMIERAMQEMLAKYSGERVV